MDIQTLIASLLIVDLQRGGYFKAPTDTKDVIKASKMVSNILYADAIDREAGGEPTPEYAIAPIAKVVGTAAYQDIVKWTVAKGRIGMLSDIEIACEDYTITRFRLVINDVEVWTDQELSDSLSLIFPDIVMRGGKTVLVQAKTNGAAKLIWGTITGKERA